MFVRSCVNVCGSVCAYVCPSVCVCIHSCLCVCVGAFGFVYVFAYACVQSPCGHRFRSLSPSDLWSTPELGGTTPLIWSPAAMFY